MESKKPANWEASRGPQRALPMPRLCVAPWRSDEDRTAVEAACPGGCVPGGCALAVEPRRWPATGWDREPAKREVAALRRSALGGWTAEDKRAAGALRDECEACGCSMGMGQLAVQHMTRDEMACPGFRVMVPPRMFRDKEGGRRAWPGERTPTSSCTYPMTAS